MSAIDDIYTDGDGLLLVDPARAARFGWEDRSTTRWDSRAPAGLRQAFTGKSHSVLVFLHESEEFGTVMRLLFRRHDGGARFGWTQLQKMKNELAGEYRVAIEVFPRECDLVDAANCRHLWVLPEGATLSFGLAKREKDERQ